MKPALWLALNRNYSTNNCFGQPVTKCLADIIFFNFLISDIRGWSISTGGWGGPEEMKTQLLKKHDPPPRNGTKCWWPTPNKLLKIYITRPQNSTLHFYHFFPYNYAYSIEYDVQNKTCTPVLIKKQSILMYYSYNSILNIDSMSIDTIYKKRH